MFAAVCNLKVRYTDTGELGFVHHGNYYKWFEEVQIVFLNKYGLSIDTLKGNETRLLPIEMECKYLRPAYYQDELEIGMLIEDYTNIKVTIGFHITRVGDAEKIAECKMVYACVDKNCRPLLLKSAMPQLYGILNRVIEDQA